MQGGDPTLGPVLERRGIGRRKRQSHHVVQVCGRLVAGHAQVGDADLDQLAASPETRQWQGRIQPGAHDDARVGWKMLDQRCELCMYLGVFDRMQVIEDKDDRAFGLGQLIEQHGDETIVRRARGDVGELDTSPCECGAKRRDDVRPEERGFVIGPVQREPGDRRATRIRPSKPLGEERGLSEPGRGRNQGQPCVRAAIKQGAQARPFYETLPRDRHMQLGCYEGAGHQAASLVRAQGRNQPCRARNGGRGAPLSPPLPVVRSGDAPLRRDARHRLAVGMDVARPASRLVGIERRQRGGREAPHQQPDAK